MGSRMYIPHYRPVSPYVSGGAKAENRSSSWRTKAAMDDTDIGGEHVPPELSITPDLKSGDMYHELLLTVPSTFPLIDFALIMDAVKTTMLGPRRRNAPPAPPASISH